MSSRRQDALLQVVVSFDPEWTDAESLATAMDRLMTTALSTPGILSDYGPVDVGEFLVAEGDM